MASLLEPWPNKFMLADDCNFRSKKMRFKSVAERMIEKLKNYGNYPFSIITGDES